jgi:hypothetical protein
VFEKLKTGIVAFAAARKILNKLRKNEKDAKRDTFLTLDYGEEVILPLKKDFIRNLYKIVGTDEKEFDAIIHSNMLRREEEEVCLREERKKDIRELNNLLRERFPANYYDKDEDDFL